MEKSEKIKELTEKLEILKQNYDDTTAIFDFRSGTLTLYKNLLKETGDLLEEAKEQEANCKAEINQLTKEVDELKLKIADADEDEKEDIKSDVDESYSQIREKAEELGKLEKKRVDLSKQYKEKEKKYFDLKEEQDKLMESAEKIKAESDEIINELSENLPEEDLKNEEKEPIEAVNQEENISAKIEENKEPDEKVEVKKQIKMTSAEAYANFLKNVSRVGPINKFFIGKKLKKEVSAYLGNVSEEEKMALISMFENPVTLINYKVPDAYSNALIANLVDKKAQLEGEAEIDDMNSLITSIVTAREAKNARVDKPFKILKNKREILLLGAMNKEIREAAVSGKDEVAEQFGEDLKEFINSNADSFGDTKEAHAREAFRSRDER